MADGGWRMADGGWRMADRKIRMIKCGDKMPMEKCGRKIANDPMQLINPYEGKLTYDVS